MISKLQIALCTTPSMEISKNIAKSLVSRQLCSCVNIIPKVISIYNWKNNIEEDEECLLVIKSSKDKFEDIQKFIENKDNHPYEIPELICIPISNGNEKYLQWLISTMNLSQKSEK